MKATQFLYKGKSYPVEVNMNVVRKFARERQLKFMSDFAKRFVFENKDDISFEQLDDILLLMHLAVQEGCRNEKLPCELQLDDIGVIMTENKELLGTLLSGLEGPEKEADEPESENPQMPGTD